MNFRKTTETDSHYQALEKMPLEDLLRNINREDQTVPLAVAKAIPQIEVLTKKVVAKLKEGGRLFYLGAGTSGRLGIVDASECPPTFGVPQDLVIGMIAGGDTAIRKAVEFAEDSTTQGWEDLKKYEVSKNDVVIGIAASGTTPYVIGALEKCNESQVVTGCITCNENSPCNHRSISHSGRCWPRVCYGEYPNESGYCTKIGVEYDFDRCYDPIGTGEG